MNPGAARRVFLELLESMRLPGERWIMGETLPSRNPNTRPTGRGARLVLLGVLAIAAAMTGCSTGEAAGRAKHKEGLERARNGDTDGAMTSFNAAVDEAPDYQEARFDLARLQFERGVRQHRVALDHLRTARRLSEEARPAEARVRERLAGEARGEAEPFFRAAEDNLRQVLAAWGDENPNAAWLHYLLGRCHLFFEDYEASLRELRRAIELAPAGGAVRRDIEEAITLIEREQIWGAGGVRPRNW